MNNNPKISVITVCLNSVKTIERTIKSVLEQQYGNLEYIIIDGGSTDGSLDIIDKYRDKLAVVVSEKDEGISDAFNKGIKLSTGDIVGILNSDDWQEKNSLAIVSDIFVRNNVACIIGALRYRDNKDNNFVVLPERNYKKRICYTMPHLNHPACFIRRDVYNKIGLFEKRWRYAMDYDLLLRVYLANYPILLTDNILANMSLGGSSDYYSLRAYYEVFMIAPCKVRAFVFFLYSVIKYYFRRVLVLCKLDKFLLSLRKFKYNNH